MPAMAAIVAKKADETTNITYDAINPAGGDGQLAFWRQDTGAPVALPTGHRPYLQQKSVWNGPKTARKLLAEYVYPYSVQNSTTTRYEKTSEVRIKYEAAVPQEIPQSVIDEAIAQGNNLFASVLFKACGKAGASAS